MKSKSILILHFLHKLVHAQYYSGAQQDVINPAYPSPIGDFSFTAYPYVNRNQQSQIYPDEKQPYQVQQQQYGMQPLPLADSFQQPSINLDALTPNYPGPQTSNNYPVQQPYLDQQPRSYPEYQQQNSGQQSPIADPFQPALNNPNSQQSSYPAPKLQNLYPQLQKYPEQQQQYLDTAPQQSINDGQQPSIADPFQQQPLNPPSQLPRFAEPQQQPPFHQPSIINSEPQQPIYPPPQDYPQSPLYPGEQQPITFPESQQIKPKIETHYTGNNNLNPVIYLEPQQQQQQQQQVIS